MPPYWISFLTAHDLLGREVSVPESIDRSAVGAEIGFLSEADSRSEAQELYPGIAVSRDGFVPVGECLLGSGDPYFIQLADGEGGPLYRIYHDEVSPEGYDRSVAVAVVLDSYHDLLHHVRA